MEDGMEQFHAWYRGAMGESLVSASDAPASSSHRALNPVIAVVGS
jgi:hypothetical protein